MLPAFLARIQSSGLATTIGQSQLLTAALSSVHLLGLTLVLGGTLVSSLRLLGAALRDRPVAEVTAAPGRAIVAGLGVSVATGMLLLAPRITTAIENGFFQIKMLVLIAAVVFYFAAFRHAARSRTEPPLQLRMTGAIGLLLWFGVAAAGAAFILLE